MRVRIHRGSHEIGGNCVEVEAEGARIVLDLGRPLWAEPSEQIPLPGVIGLDGQGEDLPLGLFLSHPHLDHCGLVSGLSARVPVFIGEDAARLLKEAAFFTRTGVVLEPRGFLHHRTNVVLGPFRITPFLQDHSAFDAYSLLIESDGRRLFYTGDFRGHGRKAALFDELLRDPPSGIDALLTEGTQVRALSNLGAGLITEQALERRLAETFRATPGMVLVAFSGQNLDRLVTVYRAAMQADRDLVVDLYAASIARATGNPNIPQPGHRRLKVIVPQNQRVRVKNTREFDRVESIRAVRLFLERLADSPGSTVLLYRSSLVAEMERAGCLEGARMVWSMWEGYLREESARPMHAFLERHGIPLTVEHTSGHASVEDLRRLADRLNPRRVVPMHTEAPERFAELFDRVEIHRDGELWEV
jgi:ribonuclease J